MRKTMMMVSVLTLIAWSAGLTEARPVADSGEAEEAVAEVAPLYVVHGDDAIAEFEAFVAELGGFSVTTGAWCCADCWYGDCCTICAKGASASCGCRWYGGAKCVCIGDVHLAQSGPEDLTTGPEAATTVD